MESSNETAFPAADVDGELYPARNNKVEVDPISSDIATSKEMIKKREDGERKEKERQRRDAMQKLKSGIMISALLVAVAGAAFAITRKLREK